MGQARVMKRVTAYMDSSAGHVNIGELALTEFGAWPFMANVCFHSDVVSG